MPSRRGPRILAGLAAGALCLYLLVVLALYAGQRRLLFMPDPSRPDLGPARSLGVRAETLRTTDGLALLAWYLPPPAGRPVILYLHGNGGNLANRIPRLLAFAKAGWGVLMPEYRGYGGNPGEPSAEGFDLDARAAAAFLDTAGIPPARWVMYGESIGTGVAVRLAAERPIGALILESPYTSITAIARRRFPFVPVGLLLRDPFRCPVAHRPGPGAAPGAAGRPRQHRAAGSGPRPVRRRAGAEAAMGRTPGRPQRPDAARRLSGDRRVRRAA